MDLKKCKSWFRLLWRRWGVKDGKNSIIWASKWWDSRKHLLSHVWTNERTNCKVPEIYRWNSYLEIFIGLLSSPILPPYSQHQGNTWLMSSLFSFFRQSEGSLLAASILSKVRTHTNVKQVVRVGCIYHQSQLHCLVPVLSLNNILPNEKMLLKSHSTTWPDAQSSTNWAGVRLKAPPLQVTTWVPERKLWRSLLVSQNPQITCCEASCTLLRLCFQNSRNTHQWFWLAAMKVTETGEKEIEKYKQEEEEKEKGEKTHYRKNILHVKKVGVVFVLQT